MKEHFYIIAYTHRNLSVQDIGVLHIAEENQLERLSPVKSSLNMDEFMFLSTCNRVEFSFCTSQNVSESFLRDLFSRLYPELSDEQIALFAENADIHRGLSAVEHLLSVASSIDSMIVGEREIITQVRNAFELCKKNGLTGDFIRILLRHTIETAKRVYTETTIATKPVSVVSLAYHKLRDMNISLDARFLIIGAGVTNTNMSKFLRKHGFKKFVVFNRTLSKAEQLAKDLDGRAMPLSALETYTEGFDVIIACTGADTHIITPELYKTLLAGEEKRKVVIDIALPQDLHPAILEEHPVTHISVNVLQKISNENLKERSKEIIHVEEIIHEALIEFRRIEKMRAIELAMREVPEKVKEIKSNALNQVFKNDIESMDPQSKETLEKVMDYMEKKYMSMPMIMAKEILLKND
ncbi:MAG: glutamyl-tRNA reductase [Flavobacteriia bacterium]|nr:glutamyl-tRNA reductase [Cryomorphaceae bacterium]